MPDEYTICWVHTESCHKCQGCNVNYRTRMCCKNCPLLRETLKWRKLPVLRPDEHAKPVPMIDRILAMKSAGATHRDIAAATGLSENTVNSYIVKANKAVGATKPHRKAG